MVMFTGYYYNRLQEDSAVKINLAGRQRMLSQKIVKEILLYKIGETSPEKIKNTLRVFSETQIALIDGGMAPIDLHSENFRYIPETTNKVSREKLLIVAKEWSSTENKILKNIETMNGESLKYIISHDDTLLIEIDDAVYALQLLSEKNNMIIRIIITCSFFMILTLLLINLIKRIKELQSASDRIKELENLLPICSSCKKIRVDNGNPMESESWTTIEEYLHTNKDMLFTHSICPDCIKKLYPGMLEGMKK